MKVEIKRYRSGKQRGSIRKNVVEIDDRPIVTCEYCGYCAKVTPNFYRYHGDNCKMISER